MMQTNGRIRQEELLILRTPKNSRTIICLYRVKGKGEVHPITRNEGTEGERRYSSTITSALDGDEW
jgi:hypothetical protein